MMLAPFYMNNLPHDVGDFDDMPVGSLRQEMAVRVSYDDGLHVYTRATILVLESGAISVTELPKKIPAMLRAIEYCHEGCSYFPTATLKG